MANYTLTAAINGATTPIGVTPAYALTGSGYPGRLSCESEIMYVTGGAGTTEISVLRGQDGTDAVAHTFGTTIADANLGASIPAVPTVFAQSIVGAHLSVHLTPASGTPTTGAVDIYALVATPS